MSEMPDLSALFSILSNSNNASEEKSNSPEDMFSNLINSSDNSSNINSNSSNDFNMPDMETIMKLMKVMKNVNTSSPSKDLLKSLKPFLNDTRKEKVDQYINLIGMTKAFEIFNELGGKMK